MGTNTMGHGRTIVLLRICAHLFFKNNFWNNFRFTDKLQRYYRAFLCTIHPHGHKSQELIWPQPLAWGLEHGGVQLMLSQQWPGLGACRVLQTVLTASLALMANFE